MIKNYIVLVVAVISFLAVGYNCHKLDNEIYYNHLLVGNTTQYKRIRAIVTAYTAIETCAKSNCIMSNGHNAKVGYIACPRELPLGTKVLVMGNSYECGDRTALKYNGRFDIFMGYTQEDHNRAIKFGKRELWITIK